MACTMSRAGFAAIRRVECCRIAFAEIPRSDLLEKLLACTPEAKHMAIAAPNKTERISTLPNTYPTEISHECLAFSKGLNAQNP
jgi:hypothetical protein